MAGCLFDRGGEADSSAGPFDQRTRRELTKEKVPHWWGIFFLISCTQHMPSSASLDWFGTPDEAQLSIDVFRDGKELVVRSLVAGVKPQDLDISVNGDLLTIRGKREEERQASSEESYYRECYWGS